MMFKLSVDKLRPGSWDRIDGFSSDGHSLRGLNSRQSGDVSVVRGPRSDEMVEGWRLYLIFPECGAVAHLTGDMEGEGSRPVLY